MGSAANGQVSANRKKFRGTLERVVAADGSVGWQIVWSDAPAAKPGQKVSKKRVPAAVAGTGFHVGRAARSAPGTDCEFQGPRQRWFCGVIVRVARVPQVSFVLIRVFRRVMA